MRNFLFSAILLLIVSLKLHAQLLIKNIFYPDVPSLSEVSDTLLTLPFWDDFSNRNGTDSLRWKVFKDVSISNSFAQNAPSIYQVIFDGTNASGNPHQSGGGLTNGLGDVLESQPINLAILTEKQRENVYLSFYWQLRGLGELPDNSDSLELQFFNIDSVWVSQNISPNNRDNLALTGGIDQLYYADDGTSLFQQVLVKIESPSFFHKGFRFRFRSFSSTAGIYDTWLIDYIYLNHSRNSADSLFFDRTISGKQGPMLWPYSQMPLHQYIVDPAKYSREIEVSFSNLDNAPHPLKYRHTLYWIDSLNASLPVDLVKLATQSLAPLEYNRIEKGLSLANINNWPNSDYVAVQSFFKYDTGDKRLFEEISQNGDTLFLPIDLRQNDSLIEYQIFHHTLAYDDGSAEFAAGINQLGSQLAVAFYLEQPDTLTAIDFYFPEVQPSPNGRAIEVYVYQRLTDEIPLRSTSYTIASSSGINEFQRIALVNPVIVRDTFYIAYRQFTNDYLGIGLDKNFMGGSSAIYINTTGQWEQNNRLSGSLLIRSVFQPGFEVPPLFSSQKINDFEIFPNPASGIISVNGEGILKIKILDLVGNSLLQSYQVKQVDISHLENGLYFVILETRMGTFSQKIIVKNE